MFWWVVLPLPLQCHLPTVCILYDILNFKSHTFVILFFFPCLICSMSVVFYSGKVFPSCSFLCLFVCAGNCWRCKPQLAHLWPTLQFLQTQPPPQSPKNKYSSRVRISQVFAYVWAHVCSVLPFSIRHTLGMRCLLWTPSDFRVSPMAELRIQTNIPWWAKPHK